MEYPMRRLRSLVLNLYEALLGLYPPRFRSQFSAEIRVVFLRRMREEERAAGNRWLAAAWQEILGLVISILRECWHEFTTRKKEAMMKERGGMLLLNPAGPPRVRWFIVWTLLTTAAIPAALITGPMLAALFVGLINLGARAGFWPASTYFPAEALGYLISLALMLSLAQGAQLRNYLPQARAWGMATGAGIFLGGLVTGLVLFAFPAPNRAPLLSMAALLLAVGIFLGLAQWLYLRRFLPNAFWIILIDVLAFGSILIAGEIYTSLLELMVFTLPGAITGMGLLLLLGHVQTGTAAPLEMQAVRSKARPRERLLWLAALIPLFFLCSWVYPASQLALAKNEGVYSSPEQGMRTMMEKGYSADHEVKILKAGPNWDDGSQPYIWYVIAEVRALSRADGSELGANGCESGGSYFLQTREGWVHVSEGAFPEFVGYWMKVYGWAGEGQSTPSTEWGPVQSRRGFCR